MLSLPPHFTTALLQAYLHRFLFYPVYYFRLQIKPQDILHGKLDSLERESMQTFQSGSDMKGIWNYQTRNLNSYD